VNEAKSKPRADRSLQSVQYIAPVQAEGKRYAVVEIIDEGTSRPVESPPNTRVRINPAGKLAALADLLRLRKPLRGPPELGHAARVNVGVPVDWSSNHVTTVLYEIPDPTAWENIHSGRWRAVSPTMTPKKAHYEGDVFVLDEWVWDDVSFVPRGAWPNAGVKSTCEGDPQLCGFHKAVASSLADPWRMRDSIGTLIGLPLGQLPSRIQAQRVRRGDLVGLPLGR